MVRRPDLLGHPLGQVSNFPRAMQACLNEARPSNTSTRSVVPPARPHLRLSSMLSSRPLLPALSESTKRRECRHGPELLDRRAGVSRRGALVAAGPTCPTSCAQKMESYQELSKDDLLRWHKILAKKGWVAPDWPDGVGRDGLERRAEVHLRGRVRLRGHPAADPVRAPHVRAGAAAVRHRGAEEALPAAHLRRHRLLVPGLLGAGLGLGPGLAQDARGARGRALRRHRPEDLDHAGPARRLDLLPRPHRREPASARTASPSC